MKKTIDKKTYFIAIGVIVVVAILACFGLYKCPFRFLFGIPCPTCGITRAMISILSLNFKDAFYYYALWPIVVVVLIVFTLFAFDRIKISKKVFNISIVILIVLVLSYYIYRHIIGSDVVAINFEESIVFKIINLFR